jgi:hypothetical protein
MKPTRKKHLPTLPTTKRIDEGNPLSCFTLMVKWDRGQLPTHPEWLIAHLHA